MLWVDKVAVFTHRFLYKGIIGEDILGLYEIHVTHKKFLDKLLNLLVIMNNLNMKFIIINTLKYASDVAEVIGIKGYGTIK